MENIRDDIADWAVANEFDAQVTFGVGEKVRQGDGKISQTRWAIITGETIQNRTLPLPRREEFRNMRLVLGRGEKKAVFIQQFVPDEGDEFTAMQLMLETEFE